MKKSVLSFRVETDLYDEIQAYADGFGISLAKMAARFLEIGLSAYKNKGISEETMESIDLLNNIPVVMESRAKYEKSGSSRIEKDPEGFIKDILEKHMPEYLDKYFNDIKPNGGENAG